MTYQIIPVTLDTNGSKNVIQPGEDDENSNAYIQDLDICLANGNFYWFSETLELDFESGVELGVISAKLNALLFTPGGPSYASDIMRYLIRLERMANIGKTRGATHLQAR